MIALMAIWNMVISIIAITALIGGYQNYKEIEAIKSWYPFCEIMRVKKSLEQIRKEKENGQTEVLAFYEECGEEWEKRIGE